jgi:hypothetical protein
MMFKKGAKLILTTLNGGAEETTYGNVVIDYADGLLKVRENGGSEIVYNMRSLIFVKAQVEG